MEAAKRRLEVEILVLFFWSDSNLVARRETPIVGFPHNLI